MSRNYRLLAIGRLIVLVGAILELRHLGEAVCQHFEGCSTAAAIIARLATLDDATIVGILTCLILAGALLLTAIADLDFRPRKQRHRSARGTQPS
jgi:hypothetical protein